MKVNYKKLWKLMIDKDLTKPELRKKAGVAPSTFSKLNKNELVSMEVMIRLCEVLNCDIGDIMEINKELL
jgi:putative transcriptional regulator